MKANSFRVTNYGASRSVVLDSFEAATAKARQFACYGNGGLPATIVDDHGCRWTLWEGQAPVLRACPAVAAGRCHYCACSDVDLGYYR